MGALLAIFFIPICEGAKIPKPALDSAVKIFTGVAASASAASSAVFFDEKAEISKDLQNRGLDTKDAAIFSLHFEVDPQASGRLLFSPNVYALVQIEGQDDFIPASIAKNYRGQPWMVSVYGRQIRPGGRVLIQILDDKQFWNSAFNSILQTEIPLNLKAGITLTPLVKVGLESDGKIKILNRDIVLQRPGYLATADFTVPESKDGTWLASASLLKDGTAVGVLQFAQVWEAPSRGRTLWMAVFFAGLTIVLGALFIRSMVTRSTMIPPKEAAAG